MPHNTVILKRMIASNDVLITDGKQQSVFEAWDSKACVAWTLHLEILFTSHTSVGVLKHLSVLNLESFPSLLVKHTLL